MNSLIYPAGVTGAVMGDGAHVVQNPDGSVFVVSAPPLPPSAAQIASERFKAAEAERYRLEATINSSGYLQLDDYAGAYDCPAPVVDARDLRLQQLLAEKDARTAAVVSGRLPVHAQLQ